MLEGGVGALIEALQHQRYALDVALSGCLSIVHLCSQKPALALTLDEQGATKVVVLLMETHRSQEVMAANCAAALALLSCGERLIAESGVEALIRALHSYPRSGKVVLHVCRALKRVAQAHSIPPAQKQQLLSADALKACHTAGQTFKPTTAAHRAAKAAEAAIALLQD